MCEAQLTAQRVIQCVSEAADFDRLALPETSVLDLILAVERHLSAKETMK